MAFLGGFFDPPASKVPTPQINAYQPTGFPAAESGVLGGAAGLSQYNTYGQYLPQAQQITQNLVNNPYAGGYQAGAGVAGQLGQQSALNAYGMGGSIAQTAFDRKTRSTTGRSSNCRISSELGRVRAALP